MTQLQLDALKLEWTAAQSAADAALAIANAKRACVVTCKTADLAFENLTNALASPSTYNQKCGDYCGFNQKTAPDCTPCSGTQTSTGVNRFKSLVNDTLSAWNNYKALQATANSKKATYDAAVASNLQQILSDPNYLLEQAKIAAAAEVAKEKAKQRTKIFIGIGITIAVLVIAYFVFKKFIFKTA